MSLQTLLDRIRQSPDKVDPNVYAAIAQRVEDAVCSDITKAELEDASNQLVSIAQDLLRLAPAEVKVVARGEPNQDRATAWAMMLGKLIFAQTLVSQAAGKRADDAFIPTMSDPRFLPIVEALAEDSKSVPELPGDMNETMNKLDEMIGLGIVDSRQEGQFRKFFLTPPAKAVLAVKKKPIEVERTERGFSVGAFVDRYGQRCSIQKSSLATEDAIWLGVDVDLDGKDGARMHLSQSQAADLLPLLQRFVETGELYEGGEVTDAFTIVKSERVYQEEFAPHEHSRADIILLMEHYLTRARTDLLCPQMADGAEGTSMRKVTALGVKYIEEFGAPMRVRKAGEPR